MPIRLLAMTTINPDSDEALNTYLGVVGPLLESAGARIVSRYELADSLAGDNEFQFVTLIEYPDEAAVRSVFDSEAYRSLGEIKRQAFSSYQVNTVVAT